MKNGSERREENRKGMGECMSSDEWLVYVHVLEFDRIRLSVPRVLDNRINGRENIGIESEAMEMLDCANVQSSGLTFDASCRFLHPVPNHFRVVR